MRHYPTTALLVGLLGCGDEFEARSTGTGGSGPLPTASSSDASNGSGAQGSECATGTTCVSAAPSGWAGPAMLHLGRPVPSQCDGGWRESRKAHAGTVTAPFECTPCECVPMGGVCSEPTVRWSFSTTCDSGTGSIALDFSGACNDIGTKAGVVVGTSSPGPGNCQVQGGSKVVSDPVWDSEAILCADPTATGSCGGGVCAPAGDAPYCIYAEEDVEECPASFPVRFLLYEGIEDSRGCEQCDCGPLTGETCSEAFSTYSDNACTQAVGQFLANNACQVSTTVHSMKFNVHAKGGSCPPSGGAPVGGVTPALPVTVCCTG
jgi:hypothetical protein